MDRTELPMSAVTELTINAEYMAKYAVPGHLEVCLAFHWCAPEEVVFRDSMA